MGGIGSGRTPDPSAQPTVQGRCALDVRALKRKGYLEPRKVSFYRWRREGRTRLTVTIAAEDHRITLLHPVVEGRDLDAGVYYPVSITWTPCALGGRHPWFLCPNCEGRVAILYSGPTFACRRCRGLVYSSQRKTDWERALDRSNKMRESLGWRPGFVSGHGPKPKWMRWQTFSRLVWRYEVDRSEALKGLSERNDRIAKAAWDYLPWATTTRDEAGMRGRESRASNSGVPNPDYSSP